MHNLKFRSTRTTWQFGGTDLAATASEPLSDVPQQPGIIHGSDRAVNDWIQAPSKPSVVEATSRRIRIAWDGLSYAVNVELDKTGEHLFEQIQKRFAKKRHLDQDAFCLYLSTNRDPDAYGDETMVSFSNEMISDDWEDAVDWLQAKQGVRVFGRIEPVDGAEPKVEDGMRHNTHEARTSTHMENDVHVRPSSPEPKDMIAPNFTPSTVDHLHSTATPPDTTNPTLPQLEDKVAPDVHESYLTEEGPGQSTPQAISLAANGDPSSRKTHDKLISDSASSSSRTSSKVDSIFSGPQDAGSSHPTSTSLNAGSDSRNEKENPTTLKFKSFESEAVQPEPDLEDLESVRSLDEDIESRADSSAPELLKYRQTAVLYLVETLTKDDELFMLYKAAVRKLDSERFVRNHRRLLKVLFVGLNADDASPSKKLALSFLRSRNRRSDISRQIFRIFMAPNETVKAEIDVMIKQESDKRTGLSQYLAELDSAACPEEPALFVVPRKSRKLPVRHLD